MAFRSGSVKVQAATAKDQRYTSLGQYQSWRPGKQRLPYWGSAAIILSLIGVIVAVAILVASNGKEINSWRYQPTVYISIATTLTNITIQFALLKGVAITWWRNAMSRGTTLADLHRTFDFGYTIWGPLTAGRKHFNAIALASLLVAIAPINGPLLQRASHISNEPIDKSVTFSVGSQKLLPDGWSGYVQGKGHIIGAYTSGFSNVVSDNANQSPITFQSDCKGLCRGRVAGVGFQAHCSTHTVPNSILSRPDIQSLVFSIDAGTEAATSYIPALTHVDILYKPSKGCNVSNIVVNCTLRAGTMNYPVIIDGNASTIALDGTIWDDVILGPMHNISDETFNLKTTYGGVYLALSNRWTDQNSVMWSTTGSQFRSPSGQSASQFLRADKGVDGYCSYFYTDPLPDILQFARDLMFRSALASSNSSTIGLTSFVETRSATVYKTDSVFLVIGTLISCFAILAVVFTFNGFWLLGREMTLSPLETAKAFDAPILVSHDSNASIGHLLKEVGHRPVMYAAVPSRQINGMEAFDQSSLSAPDADPSEEGIQYQLKMADPSAVEMRLPTTGERFSG